MFVRSQNIRDLTRRVNDLHESGMLHFTNSQRRQAEEVIEPVPYFTIAPQTARAMKMGTMVMSFVNLNAHGFLSLYAPKAYGVRERPTEAVVEYDGLRLQESHVIAEDMALRRGLYTPLGRASAELFVAQKVAEDGNAAAYVPDRISHLHGLIEEIQRESVFTRTGQITGELERGIDTLKVYLDELA